MIYVAGPITGLDREMVKARFKEVVSQLRKIDERLEIINPLELGIPDTWSWDDQLAECKRTIRQNATAIFFMNGWRNSKGCHEELECVADLNNRHHEIMIFEESNYGYHRVKWAIDREKLTCLKKDND